MAIVLKIDVKFFFSFEICPSIGGVKGHVLHFSTPEVRGMDHTGWVWSYSHVCHLGYKQCAQGM